MSTVAGERRRSRHGRRHRARELALRVLFELDGSDREAEEALSYQAVDMAVPPDVEAFGRSLVEGWLSRRSEIDAAIAAATTNWQMANLGRVERAVLRLGAEELLFAGQTPLPVVIDESVELAKAYAGQEAAAFVNGVLGRLASGVEA